MTGPDPLSQVIGTLLLALAFSAFIIFVRGYRPQGVSALWYDLMLAFIGLWLAFWPQAWLLLHAPVKGTALALLFHLFATLLGGVLGALLARLLRWLMLERRGGKVAATRRRPHR
ncbi:MAG: hypothetical protein ACN6QH_21530 [Pseudomonas sp.]|uniref:hypothetical protein n=1 Tax=Pseudomonas sp. TaxID=306 RepID=UPI003D0EA9D8